MSTYLVFTPRLHEAIDLTARVHEAQHRKEPDRRTPYVAHVFGVALILARYGFSEEVIIAGLLHDVLEDQPQCRADVECFGPEVLGWIEWVSERKFDDRGEKLPWVERKHAYNERMRRAPLEARAISAADKIHNMQSTIMALERGQDAWAALTGTREQHLERYHNLLEILVVAGDHPILRYYATVLARLERIAPPG
jgi:(p)ppGpp synthase/HD superfamily hydrolase